MGLNLCGPFLEDFSHSFSFRRLEFSHWHSVEEYVHCPDVKYAANNTVFSKDQLWQTQGKQDSTLQLIPGSWKRLGAASLDGGLARSALPPRALRRSELAKTKNEATCTAACELQHLAQGKTRGVIGSAYRARLQPEPAQFAIYEPPGGLLL